MKRTMFCVGVAILSAACGSVFAQAPSEPGAPVPPPQPAATGTGLSAAILEWVPPALTQLTSQALAKESFTLDRTMLVAAAGMLPDSNDDVRQAAAKLDGVSVHILRFAATATADPAQVEAIRQAYHLRGWKHLMSASNAGGPVHSGNTDVWLVMDGVNVRGAVVLVDTPKSLTLTTMAGDLSPVDLLHLRGHFGIPRFEGDTLTESQGK